LNINWKIQWSANPNLKVQSYWKIKKETSCVPRGHLSPSVNGVTDVGTSVKIETLESLCPVVNVTPGKTLSYMKNELKEEFPSFPELWKTDLSLVPEVPMCWKERELWKVFGERIYNRLMNGSEIMDLISTFRADGYDEGVSKVRTNFKNKFEQLKTPYTKEDILSIIEKL
jgi:hypothetical protein